MLKSGFILNYLGGAKGDFLIAFLFDVIPNINEFGRSRGNVFSNRIRYKESEIENIYHRNIIKQKYNEIIPDFILQQSNKFPYATHWLNNLTPENYEKVLIKFPNTYNLIVEEEFYDEVIINWIFKTGFTLLDNNKISQLQKVNSKFNGQYEIDRLIFRLCNYECVEFNDELRLEKTLELLQNKSSWQKYSKLQKESSTKKIYYSKLFYPPYDDLIELYVLIRDKSPNIELFESLLSKTNVPKELDYFNYKIRINLKSDSKVEVIGRNSNDKSI